MYIQTATNIMKRLNAVSIAIILIAIQILIGTSLAHSQQLRAPEKEYVFLNIMGDFADTKPSNDCQCLREYGLDYVVGFGLSSSVGNVIGFELKGGIEYFPKLEGGFTSYYGATGVKLVYGYNEEWRYYAGIRLTKTYREGPVLGKAFRAGLGWEFIATRDITDNLAIGLRGTVDNGQDMDIMGWEIKNRYGGYLVLHFKLFDL